MSSRTISKNTQLIVAGLAAAATISLVVYYASLKPATSSSKKEKKLDYNGDGSTTKNEKSVLASTKSRNVKNTTCPDDTPKKSNVTDEKELHSKIEELDKKGKALFKNKKVCYM